MVHPDELNHSKELAKQLQDPKVSEKPYRAER